MKKMISLLFIYDGRPVDRLPAVLKQMRSLVSSLRRSESRVSSLSSYKYDLDVLQPYIKGWQCVFHSLQSKQLRQLNSVDLVNIQAFQGVLKMCIQKTEGLHKQLKAVVKRAIDTLGSTDGVHDSFEFLELFLTVMKCQLNVLSHLKQYTASSHEVSKGIGQLMTFPFNDRELFMERTSQLSHLHTDFMSIRRQMGCLEDKKVLDEDLFADIICWALWSSIEDVEGFSEKINLSAWSDVLSGDVLSSLRNARIPEKLSQGSISRYYKVLSTGLRSVLESVKKPEIMATLTQEKRCFLKSFLNNCKGLPDGRIMEYFELSKSLASVFFESISYLSCVDFQVSVFDVDDMCIIEDLFLNIARRRVSFSNAGFVKVNSSDELPAAFRIYEDMHPPEQACLEWVDRYISNLEEHVVSSAMHATVSVYRESEQKSRFEELCRSEGRGDVEMGKKALMEGYSPDGCKVIAYLIRYKFQIVDFLSHCFDEKSFTDSLVNYDSIRKLRTMPDPMRRLWNLYHGLSIVSRCDDEFVKAVSLFKSDMSCYRLSVLEKLLGTATVIHIVNRIKSFRNQLAITSDVNPNLTWRARLGSLLRSRPKIPSTLRGGEESSDSVSKPSTKNSATSLQVKTWKVAIKDTVQLYLEILYTPYRSEAFALMPSMETLFSDTYSLSVVDVASTAILCTEMGRSIEKADFFDDTILSSHLKTLRNRLAIQTNSERRALEAKSSGLLLKQLSSYHDALNKSDVRKREFCQLLISSELDLKTFLHKLSLKSFSTFLTKSSVEILLRSGEVNRVLTLIEEIYPRIFNGTLRRSELKSVMLDILDFWSGELKKNPKLLVDEKQLLTIEF